MLNVEDDFDHYMDMFFFINNGILQREVFDSLFSKGLCISETYQANKSLLDGDGIGLCATLDK